MNTRHRHYFRILLFSFCATLLPVLVLNMILLNDTLGNNQKVLLASQWQQRTQGVTYAPTLSDTHLFKTLRLLDRLPEINTVVFGSSTALGIAQSAFPDTLHLYNYAQTGHALSSVIGEAEYIQRHSANVKWLIIPLDWSLGFIYQEGTPPDADLSASTAMQATQAKVKSVPLLERIRDALSYPRISSLFEILNNIRRADDKIAAFSGYFLQDASDEYRCADGTAGKDFDTIYRGTCTGFRHDGSATFANSSRVGNPRSLILASTSSHSQYRRSLLSADGSVNPIFLQRLAELGRQARQNGGGLILFFPPLLPGMEVEFLHHPQLMPALQKTKQTLADWAGENRLTLLDAGQSERFDCRPDEFLDPHHAVSGCYNKIFQPFWRDALRPDGTLSLPPAGLKP